MKNILKILTICFCLIGINSCSPDNSYNEYAKEVGKRIDEITITTKIKRDGHTYIIFHSTQESFGAVHDPDCCNNNSYRSEYE